jgi:hypothetical protein
MSIDVAEATDRDALDDWNRYVEQSPHGTVFHLRETLDVLADHSGTEVHRLVGYKGQEPVGVLPVFELTRMGVSAVFSPPPGLLVPFLGPALLNFEKLKRRKAERRHERFVEECLDWVADELGPRYSHLQSSPGYDDLRPYVWNDFEVEPSYTYRVDITGDPDELMMTFSSDARKNIQNTDDSRYTIREGDWRTVRRIVDRIEERYAEQDETYPLTKSFVHDLYASLPAGTTRPYECIHDGSFVGGAVTLEFDDVLYRWQASTDHDAAIPVNDLLDWHLIEEGRTRGRERYDLVGANTPRLNDYKAKFAPELVPVCGASRGTHDMKLLAALYRSDVFESLSATVLQR